MNVASNCPTHRNRVFCIIHAAPSASVPRAARRVAPLASLVLALAGGCGGRTVEGSETVTDGLSSTITVAEVDAGALNSSTTPPVVGSPTGSSGAPSSGTFVTSGPLPTGSAPIGTVFTNPPATVITSSSSGTDFTAPSTSPVDSSTVNPVTTGTNFTSSSPTSVDPTSGVGSTTNPCLDGGWCVQSNWAPERTFHSLSRDGAYAAGMGGVVVALPDIYLPEAPVTGSGFIEATAEGVWLGGPEGLFGYGDGAWTRFDPGPVLALAQSPAGTTWVLSQATGVARLSGSEWLSQALPEGVTGIDLIAKDDTTAWLLAGQRASGTRAGIEPGNLTLYELTDSGATLLSELAESELTDPKLVRGGDRIYVHDQSGQSMDIIDPTTWLASRVKPAGAMGLFEAPHGAFATNVWPDLTIFNTRAAGPIFGQMCHDVVFLDDYNSLCATFDGGVIRLQGL